MADHHSFATGGHGKDEYFGEPDKLSDRIDGRTAETCNVYNMLKLTRTLFALEPEPRYAEFHERALFNHILGSIDPEDGSTCYMVPVGMGVQREYADMFRSFTCCVGCGMESHALHGDGIYYEDGEQLWVNLYAPSTAEWKAAGVTFDDGNRLSRGRIGNRDVDARSAQRIHAGVAAAGLGGRWIPRRSQRRGDRRFAEAGLVRGNQANLEDRRQSGAHTAEDNCTWNHCPTTRSVSP